MMRTPIFLRPDVLLAPGEPTSFCSESDALKLYRYKRKLMLTFYREQITQYVDKNVIFVIWDVKLLK